MKFWGWILVFMVVLNGCSAQSKIGSQTVHFDATPLPRVETALPATAAATFASPTAVSPALPATPTPTPTIFLTPTRADTATITPTSGPIRDTPPTLMLHKRSDSFDSVAFLRDFIPILKARNYHVTTYQEISAHPEITAVERDHLFIITIDDVMLGLEIEPSIKEMIDVLKAAGYPAVLGVVTEGKVPNPATARLLKELAGQGWEIASHTDTHADLHVMEYDYHGDVRAEIRTSQAKIFQATRVTPITLVLPYGAMVDQTKLLWKEKIVWAVGINGGVVYNVTTWVHYVGREGPGGTALQTFENMIKRFGKDNP